MEFGVCSDLIGLVQLNESSKNQMYRGIIQGEVVPGHAAAGYADCFHTAYRRRSWSDNKRH
jgi:hypothetical protein